MSAPASALPATRSDPTVAALLARSHDRSMAQCDRMLGPVMNPDATFFERWGAVRFVREPLGERFLLEQKLVEELQPALAPEVREQIQRQGELVGRLRDDVERLAGGRCTARDLARAAQELVRALRLWYAEIEFGLGELRRADLVDQASHLLDQLSYRPVLNNSIPG